MPKPDVFPKKKHYYEIEHNTPQNAKQDNTRQINERQYDTIQPRIFYNTTQYTTQ
jgi:hypothetical protein